MAQTQPIFYDVDSQDLATTLNTIAADADTAWYRQALAAANAVAPANTAGDYVVGVYTLPAGAFGGNAGQVQNLYISTAGVFAANNNSKRIKIFAGATNPTVGAVVSGGTLIADTGAQTTSANGGGWLLQSQILRVGVNKQLAVQDGAIVNASHVGTLAPIDLTLTEANAITICVTVNNTTTASDAKYQYLEVDALA